jgi:predicted transcriptional regulator
MASLSSQKSNLLSRISKIENSKMLFTIETFLNTLEDNSIIITSKAEKKAIQNGIDDIENGNFYSQSEIDEMDMKWLKEK